MIGQVQEINNQKVIVPLSDVTPVDVVESGNANSVTSNAVFDATNIKYVDVAENGSSITTTKWGFFVFGAETSWFIKSVGANVTVSPTNTYWGDPISGSPKRMKGIYI